MILKIVGNRYYIEGEEVTREEFFQRAPKPVSGGRPGDSLVQFQPIVSIAMAVHPKRRQEAIDDAKKKGVPTEFMPDGRPVFRTRSHRKAYLKAYGYHDNNGGYGD